MYRPSRRAWAGIATCMSLAAAGCGSSSSSSSTTTAPSSGTSTTAASAYSLKGICPDTIVTQTDWNPEADHSELYELALGAGGVIDNNKKTYTAEMVVHGQDTGVKIQVRIGGPAIGYNSIDAQMYTDTSILLGYVTTDGAIEDSATQPTIALVAPRQISPLMFMWDPAQHPSFKTISDIGQSNVKILVQSGVAYTPYLESKGIIKASQVDSSYDSTPTRWVASGGSIVQQGFVTAEPYIYSHELTQWDKPISTSLLSTTGYDPYQSALATIPGNVTKYAACFKKLIPDIQQAQVDYAASPDAANALVVKLVTAYNNGWIYDAATAAYSTKAQLDSKIIANGTDGVMGSEDTTRVQNLIATLGPIYAKLGKNIKPGLQPSDIFTNQFLDPSIKLP